MVTKLHILLTYNCSLKCKHCYVFSDQKAPGKISLGQVSRLLIEGRKVQGVEWVYFGGGEPFTQYPMLLKAIQQARKLDYRVGVETNGFFGRTEESAIRLLKPLARMEVEDLRVSNDFLHYRNPQSSPAKKVLDAARRLGIPTTLVHISDPGTSSSNAIPDSYTDQIDELRFMYVGRAAEKYSQREPGTDPKTLHNCPRTDLAAPDRLFIDAYGFVQVCPGIAIGNAHHVSLPEMITSLDINKHAILGLLNDYGPSGLIENFDLHFDNEFIDACHACYSARKMLINQYPEHLGPRHVYGI